MNITPYIYIFIPSLIGISFYNKLAKNKSNKFNFVKFFVYVLLSNMIVLLFLNYFTKFNGDIFTKIANYSHYAFRYALLLIVINIFIGYIDFARLKFFDFEVEEPKNGKKN